MPYGGHLEWSASYRPGKVVATGYVAGKRVLREVLETAGIPVRLAVESETVGDLTVCNVRVLDAKGRFVPTACVPLRITLSDGSGRILGGGNGDPAFRAAERPADPSARTFTLSSFNGLAQFLLQGPASFIVSLQ